MYDKEYWRSVIADEGFDKFIDIFEKIAPEIKREYKYLCEECGRGVADEMLNLAYSEVYTQPLSEISIKILDDDIKAMEAKLKEYESKTEKEKELYWREQLLKGEIL